MKTTTKRQGNCTRSALLEPIYKRAIQAFKDGHLPKHLVKLEQYQIVNQSTVYRWHYAYLNSLQETVETA